MTLSIDSVQLSDLWTDPYPVYAHLRENQPVSWVPSTGRYLITRQQDVLDVERNTAVFSNCETPTLAERVMGETILRKDGEDHRRQRIALEAPLKPRAVREHWLPLFQRNAETLVGAFTDAGRADLFTDFAAPLAGMNLAAFLGLRGVTAHQLIEWSQALIDGAGNYADDAGVWARCDAATRAVDDAITEAMAFLRGSPDHSVISSMMHAVDPLTEAQIRGNVKVVIGGGLNEPRDALLVGAHGLLTNPSQRADVMADAALWKKVFEEAVRWVSPIGMYPRQVVTEVEVAGVKLRPGDRVGLVVASANRDRTVYDHADEFDIHRSVAHHVAFGGGPHFCAGAWVSRAAVGQAGLPTLFGRLRNLRLDDAEPVRWGGWVFRGPLTMPVTWDA
ncbi:cytochrome P450 [Streptomyces sp. NPDC059255]|uniref:cytochrome P450 n=1 Tax=Streptomyces sp. NPDC059255 TaxID=3346793 RepID=UPI0036C9B65C